MTKETATDSDKTDTPQSEKPIEDIHKNSIIIPKKTLYYALVILLVLIAGMAGYIYGSLNDDCKGTTDSPQIKIQSPITTKKSIKFELDDASSVISCASKSYNCTRQSLFAGILYCLDYKCDYTTISCGHTIPTSQACSEECVSKCKEFDLEYEKYNFLFNGTTSYGGQDRVTMNMTELYKITLDKVDVGKACEDICPAGAACSANICDCYCMQ
jgi:hypothetical protein